MRELLEFERELSTIVGPELARDMIQFARRPTPLEARLLRSDGVDELSPAQRARALALIERYIG